MPHFDNRFEFEPSLNAKRIWRGTRKNGGDFGNVKTPGLFETVDFGTDATWFIIAMIIEASAFIMVLWGGFSRGGFYIVASLGVSVFPFNISLSMLN